MNERTFARYLYESYKRNIIEFRLAVREVDGVTEFYIHPLSRDGETVDFYAVGNLLIPAAVNGVVSGFIPAVKADCDQFIATPGLSRCPKCQGDLLGFMFDERWYVAIDGGVSPNTPDGPGEAWVLGIQTCPSMGSGRVTTVARMHYLRTADNGEPTLWWAWQDLRGGVERKGPAPKGFCTHGRAWLRSLHNGVGVEWHLFSRACGASITFSTMGDEAIMVSLAIPFLVSLYLSLDKAAWVEWLPGVGYRSGDYDSGERESRIAVHHNAVWWSIWINGMGMRHNSWRDGCFHIDDFFLGRPKYTETERQRHETFLIMPEGRYPATVDLFTSAWKRPRWPFAVQVQRANVTVPGGVPVPGAGENSWDMDDDAIFEGVYPAATIEDGLAELRESVLRDRQHHAGEGWVPDAGWPAHCLRAVT